MSVCSIFKLAQGEYVSPERVETVYARHEIVAQIFVYGDSIQPNLIAIVVPDADTLGPWAVSEGIEGAANKSYKELCEDPAVVAAAFKSLAAFAKTTDLKGFECVKKIHIHSEAFSLENNLLTPTFKLKRFEAKQKFEDEIKGMYAELTK